MAVLVWQKSPECFDTSYLKKCKDFFLKGYSLFGHLKKDPCIFI